MKSYRLIILCIAFSMLFGCSQTDSNSVADDSNVSVSSADINGAEVTTTEEQTESPTEPEPEIILNDSVVSLSVQSGFYENEFSLEL